MNFSNVAPLSSAFSSRGPPPVIDPSQSDAEGAQMEQVASILSRNVEELQELLSVPQDVSSLSLASAKSPSVLHHSGQYSVSAIPAQAAVPVTTTAGGVKMEKRSRDWVTFDGRFNRMFGIILWVF